MTTPYAVELRDRFLIAQFPEPWPVLSWAIVNGGWQRTRQIAWFYLQLNELQHIDDPADWLRSHMHHNQLAAAVGFMTSRSRHRFVEASATDQHQTAYAIGTLGFSNALRAGDPSGPAAPSTINLLCCAPQRLTVEGALEAIALASEAKAAAILDSGLTSTRTGQPATGTGTDYIAIAWPPYGPTANYAGKHTPTGAAIGKATYDLVTEGALQWLSEPRPSGSGHP